MTTIETEKNNVFHIVDNTYTQSAYKMMPPNYQVNGCTFNFLCKKHSKVKKNNITYMTMKPARFVSTTSSSGDDAKLTLSTW